MHEAISMPKVDKAQIPLAVEHQVLGLEIAVHNAQTVQVHQRRDDHRQVERGGGWLEAVDLAQQVEELTAAHLWGRRRGVVVSTCMQRPS
jgi:hypothetical protein